MPGIQTAFAQGLAANRPAASTANAGWFYFSTDTGILTQSNGSSWVQVAAGTGVAGTVTSVGLSLPAEFSVSGSPVTGSGTLSATKANQSANQVYAGPSSGAAAQPAFRALVNADVPSPLTISGEMTASDFTPSGLSGATQSSRYVGATTSGAPASGTFSVGDWVIARNGHIFVCTTAGSPGTWTDVGTAGGLSSPLTTKGDVWVYGSADTRLPAGSNGQVLTADSTQTLGVKWAAAAGGGLYSAYVNIQDQRTSGTSGGTFSSGAWRTRTLNTTVADTASLTSLASNQVTLSAGTYRVRAMAQAWNCADNQMRLQNVTDAATLVTGENAYSNTGAGCTAHLAGRFTLAGSKTLELQHRCTTSSAGSDGLGRPCSFGTEVYATLELWKE